MPSKDKEVLSRAAKKHWEKIKDNEDVKAAARARAKAWYEANKEKAKAWAEANKEKRKEQLKAWKAANPEKVKEQRMKSQSINKEAAYARIKRYHSTEKGKLSLAVHRDLYRKRVKEASLGMYDAKAMTDIYRSCKLLTKTTGIKYEVDHIIPIVNDLVCGLHVSWNMRIVTAKENREKSNKFNVDSITIDS
jgi:hypothetical protein